MNCQLEDNLLKRINNYFKSKHMTLEDKLFYAKLIAILDLEQGNYSKEQERKTIEEFVMNLKKINQT